MTSNGFSLKPPPLQLSPALLMAEQRPKVNTVLKVQMKDAKLLMRGLVIWKTVVVDRKREQGMQKRARCWHMFFFWSMLCCVVLTLPSFCLFLARRLSEAGLQFSAAGRPDPRSKSSMLIPAAIAQAHPS